MQTSDTTSRFVPRFIVSAMNAAQRPDDAAEPQPSDASRLKERQQQPHGRKQGDQNQSRTTETPAEDPPSNNGLVEG